MSEQSQPATVGILILDTRFPRPPGDIGNIATWPFPVLYKTVHGASPERVVHRKGEGLLEPFVRAAEELISEGADGITTTCGFLSLFQSELAAAIPVPVVTSSLLQVDLVNTFPHLRLIQLQPLAVSRSDDQLPIVAECGTTRTFKPVEHGHLLLHSAIPY